jgi:hypothetical protein
MRILSMLMFASAAAVAIAAVNSVNLDAPGALEALKRDRPEHYEKVFEAMDRVQAVPYSEKGVHDLRLDVLKPDPTRREIETSFPAKTRLTVPVEGTNYLITVLYVKNPARTMPAK